ncbi:MAG TPA: 16S rRNA (adenine(1518)-N(6)/adenine(1519)-N(6))-dimethyltransferase RsmA [Nitrospiraceae bacterium]|nr:16S rRNA (adenine(1518)-N(6)/adenine(1519)-N(6))-dimethyltransferase RsmA [Nitrospiraceae bacterium]
MARSPLPPPLKRLGQNFLIDPNIVRKIVALAALSAQETVLEIGPGRGILTEALARAAGRVVAIEIDPLLHRFLHERQEAWPNVELICADALDYPLGGLPIGTIVVANLPYYISTALLFRLLEQRDRFPRLVLMLQEEVADRLVARPGDEAYGVLSVMAQYAADIEKAFKVSANCFRPRPEVGSAVVLIKPKQSGRLARGEELTFRAIVKAAFAHRRKTLVNSLRNEGYEAEAVAAALQVLSLPPSVRAESLSVMEFMELTRRVPDPQEK